MRSGAGRLRSPVVRTSTSQPSGSQRGQTGPMRPSPPLPSRPRDDTWLWALTGLALGLFGLASFVRWRCTLGACPLAGHEWVLDLDAVGGLPRMFTTGLFLAAAAAAGWTAVYSRAGARPWWALVAVVGVGLAGAKLVSTHSVLERWDGRHLTLVVGTAATVVGLPLLWAAGRRGRVVGAGVVVAALAAYATAALGLDVVTGLVSSGAPRPLPMAAATFVEELGEALTALALLAVVVRLVPRRDDGPPVVVSSVVSRRGRSARRPPPAPQR